MYNLLCQLPMTKVARHGTSLQVRHRKHPLTSALEASHINCGCRRRQRRTEPSRTFPLSSIYVESSHPKLIQAKYFGKVRDDIALADCCVSQLKLKAEDGEPVEA
jgi:hypothetical protein